MLGLISHGLCGLSLVLQLCGIKLRTDMGDYSAIDDTIEGIIYCAAVLITVTVSLNIIALLRQRHQRNEV